MGLFGSRKQADGKIDFTPLIPHAAGIDWRIEEANWMHDLSTRVHCITGPLDPTLGNCLTRVVPDDVAANDMVEPKYRKHWVIRDVRLLATIPAAAERFVGISWLLVPKGVDDRLVKILPQPPYFERGVKKKMRRVSEMAAHGYYWGMSDIAEWGWQYRGPGNPHMHDIRGPDDVSQYDQLCPRVPWT